MMIFSLILALLIAIVAVIFALGNTDPVTISFLTWQLEEQPLALVLLVALAIGILIGILLMTPGAVRRNLALSGEKKRLKNAEKELDQHKSKVTELEEKVKEKELEGQRKAEEAEAQRKEAELAKSLAGARDLAKGSDKTSNLQF